MKKNLEVPAEVKLTTAELKLMAKELGVKNWWTLKRAELEMAITLTKVNSQKEEKKEEEVVNEDIITLKEIISGLPIKGTKARRILRDKEIERPYTRWEWHKKDHKKIIEKVKDLLS